MSRHERGPAFASSIVSGDFACVHSRSPCLTCPSVAFILRRSDCLGPVYSLQARCPACEESLDGEHSCVEVHVFGFQVLRLPYLLASMFTRTVFQCSGFPPIRAWLDDLLGDVFVTLLFVHVHAESVFHRGVVCPSFPCSGYVLHLRHEKMKCSQEQSYAVFCETHAVRT